MVLQACSMTNKMQPRIQQHVALTGLWELHCHRYHCGGLPSCCTMARHSRRACKLCRATCRL